MGDKETISSKVRELLGHDYCCLIVLAEKQNSCQLNDTNVYVQKASVSPRGEKSDKLSRRMIRPAR